MKVAIATPILFDKKSPFNHLFRDIIEGLLNSGDKVIRLVAIRNAFEDDYMYGLKDVEYVLFKRKESRHSNIFSRYIRDNLTAIREAAFLKTIDADVLFEDVSYSSFWTVRSAKKRGMRIVAMLQDVWPDNAIQSGLISKGGILYRYFEFWQKSVYKNADAIICISHDMKDFIISKGIDANKISVIYNWGYSDDIVTISWADNLFVKKYDLKKDFYAVYAGNIGMMQNVELIVKAARKMPDTKFIIIGDGTNKKNIEKLVSGYSNILLLPLQPSELAEHIYSMAGVNIIPLVEGGTKTAMPSKTGVVLSCGNPVIFCFGSGTRFARIVENNEAGTSVSATDEFELINQIYKIKNNTDNSTSKNYNLFISLFRRSNNIKKYMKVIHNE